jgi:hypothetical protein
MVNWTFGDEKEGKETDKLKIKLATPRMKILVNFRGMGLFLFERISCVATLIETSFPQPE